MLTNFYTIQIPFEEYNILRTPCENGLLQELRNKFNSTHSFFKIGDFIYGSNKIGEDLDIGNFVNVATYKDHKVTSSLIKHIFFRTFREKFPDIIPLNFYPFRIQSRKPSHDIIHSVLPVELQDRIAFKKQVEIQLRLIERQGKPEFGLLINTPRRWIFNFDCLEIYREGYDLIGCEVLHSTILPGLEGILASKEPFIGILRQIENEHGIIHTNEGEQKISLKELFLRKTKRNIQSYLKFRIGQTDYKRVENKINSQKEVIYNLKNINKEIQDIAELISKERDTGESVQYLNKDGFVFTISSDPDLPNESFTLSNPTFIFDPARTQTDNQYPDRGLSNYGSYDSSSFNPKSPKILAICHKGTRGRFSQFLNALIEGLPDSRYFKKGLKRKYDLHDVTHTIEEINEYSYHAYEQIILELEERPDIALIEIPGQFHELSTRENPYYLLKSRLLMKEIPIQFITTEKLKKYDQYLLNSLALQMYAKLGGIPWVLASSQSIDREVIVGIGHRIIRSNPFAKNEQKRVVGITTFFSGDGQYLFANKTKDVLYEEYFNELLKNLRSSFETLSKTQGWKDGDTIRLIFHIFKPIKNIEFEVVSNLIREFNKYKIQFAFVTIGKMHPFLLFDPDQQGKTKRYNSNKKIGQFIPKRGANIILDSSSCLIQMLGVDQLKTGKHGSSAPLLIRIRRPDGDFEYKDIEELLFTDLNYVVQQIFHFTNLSWRSFLPSGEPATMLYSNLIADLLGNLRQIDGWKPDTVNLNLKYKKWFL